ncbi:cobyrinic acid a,c-diamide synthase [Pseudomonas protegens]|uniref:Cobyrinic acid a,c-diamide synthase n=1 Tax=Pseudomonas protegens TaxID=380021 RepID=A0A2T6GB63_9PSED|nr:ParA family protein [Pseudomonas protegens]PUA41391.1 cobyrinic acid a,c-diamide synthase [Pseudomonas protegens]
MKITSLISTKGGTGKSTTCANLGAFCAEAGLRTLLIDLDPVQPSLSSYFPLTHEANGGLYEMITANITDQTQVISHTNIPNLSLVLSNDLNNQLLHLILQASDGRLRLANLMPTLRERFDLVLIDTQGARSALLEMVVLASDLALSPLPPNMLAAREFQRGTLQMLDGLRPYERLGLSIPPVRIIVNGLDQTADTFAIHQLVREVFHNNHSINVLDSTLPAAVIFRKAATEGAPAHRLEYRQPSNRKSPSALCLIRQLAIEVFPEWRERFEAVTEDRIAALVKEGR